MLQPMTSEVADIHKRLQGGARVPLWELDRYLDWHNEQMKHKHWRHSPSNAVYEVVGIGLQNTSNGECRVEVQYRPVDTAGARVVFHRAIEEFNDGRFSPVRQEQVWQLV